MKQQGVLPFIVEPDGSNEKITSFAGLPLVSETFRALGLPEAIRAHLKLKERQAGYTEAQMIESFVLLFAAGGDCFEDIEVLSADPGLKALLGMKRFPSPEAMRFFCYAFHDDGKIEEAKKNRPHDLVVYIPEETEALKALGVLNTGVVGKVQRHTPSPTATLDLDATIIEADKKEALWTYESEKGYQPLVGVWAEQGLIVADEFRDGNVPAGWRGRAFIARCLSALPETVKEIFLRSDSALYDHEVIEFCKDGGANGTGREIFFAISADMTEELRAKAVAVPEAEWKPLVGLREEDLLPGRKQWAEVEFVPRKPGENKTLRPDRYLAIRVSPSQRELFADGHRYHYFAVVTNRWKEKGNEVILWHRGKAGTVEIAHDIVKNDLGGSVMPCGRFGANAAWFRLNVLTHNILVAMKKAALPPEMGKLRLKALRFRLLRAAGKVIHSGRQMILRIAQRLEAYALLIEARPRLVAAFAGSP